MNGLRLDAPAGRPLRVLCIGAHADDIEIGAGGTILTLLDRHPGTLFRLAVFTGDDRRRQESMASAAAFLAGAGGWEARHFGLREGFLPYEAAPAKEAMQSLGREFQPDLILTHRRQGDRHQDHAILGDLTWQAFRDHLILEYEIAKWEGDLVTPNLYVPLTETVARRKVALLEANFLSQRERYWFKAENFMALMRLRGIESRAEEGLAEGFHAGKLALIL
jgi:LmbE family N-acetylglucosaminyl deacetylase